MFPGYTPKNKVVVATAEEVKAATQRGTFFAGSTKDINVTESRFSQPAVNIANDPTDVEERLQALVVMKRVRIEEFFRDFDKLRKGKVTINQFKGVLSLLNFRLSELELESLSGKYLTDDKMFNYFGFCNTINQAFTIKGIDKNPTVSVKAVTKEDTILARRKFLQTTPEEEAAVAEVIMQYRVAIQNKRMNIKPMYQDFDITKNGHVSKMQFVRVLAQLGINAPDNLMHLVLKRYMDKGNVEEVNYVDFCNDIDTPEDMFGVGRDYNQSTNFFARTQP